MNTSALQTLCALSALLVFSVATPVTAQSQDDDGLGIGSGSFIDGVTVGGGISSYQGDLDNNVNNNYLKYLGAARPNLFVRADRRSGPYTYGLELGYDRIGGERQFEPRNVPFSFSNNAVSLDLVGSIDFGVPKADMVRFFGGIGPTLFVSPSYEGFQEVEIAPNEEFRDDGTNLFFNLMFGFNIQDAVRIGTRIFPTDYVDGFRGLDGYPPAYNSKVDFLLFINVAHRFDLSGN